MAKKLKIRLYKNGTVEMETIGIKGEKCKEYIPFLEEIADVRVTSTKETSDYYETENATVNFEQNFE